MPVLTITSPYVHARVNSNTFTMGNPMQSRPMPESTLSPSQGLWIWPLESTRLILQRLHSKGTLEF
jgi:hypothetical protein